MSDDLKKLCVVLTDLVLARDSRIADLERQLAEARRVVGEEELVEIVARAVSDFRVSQIAAMINRDVSTVQAGWDHHTTAGRAEAMKEASAVLSAVYAPIAAAERERCAKVCIDRSKELRRRAQRCPEKSEDRISLMQDEVVIWFCVDAIRALGTEPKP